MRNAVHRLCMPTDYTHAMSRNPLNENFNPKGTPNVNLHGTKKWNPAIQAKLNAIMVPDYMGNTDYEFGAFNRAISDLPALAGRGRMVTFKTTAACKYWTRTSYDTCELPVYAIAPTEQFAPAVAVVHRLGDESIYRSEPSHFDYTAESVRQGKEPRVVGWMDYETATFATVSQKMFLGLADLFGFNLTALQPLIDAPIGIVSMKQSLGQPERGLPDNALGYLKVPQAA